ncbi:unnamed protein product [Ambrosiozyma monospora]|uniref:Unnamed protein product n=1 Tax=Ambrosiozyma monospora TaxID=43982 RepID=A0A9W6YRQ1_AMBMO|nr:unnamed protein product [Ambrosiozyma monospora]
MLNHPVGQHYEVLDLNASFVIILKQYGVSEGLAVATFGLRSWLPSTTSFAIRYVFTTRDQGIIFHPESDCQLSLFNDAALKISTQSGGVVYFGSTLIYWHSVKHQQYVNSSTVNLLKCQLCILCLLLICTLQPSSTILLAAAEYRYPYQVFVGNKPLQHRLHGRRQFTEVPDRRPKYYELAN